MIDFGKPLRIDSLADTPRQIRQGLDVMRGDAPLRPILCRKIGH